MAISTNSPEKTTEHQPPTQQPSKSDLPEPSSAPPSSIPATTVLAVNPNPSFNNSHPTPVPQIQPFLPPSQVSAVHPSFRPVAIAPGHQFSPVSFQNHVIQGQVQVQPPGVMAQAPSQQSTGANAMQVVQQMVQPPHYGQPGQQPMRMYAPLPNGYHQMAVPQGAMNPPGILRYAPPYPQMLRPTYPQRPLGPVGVIPTLQRPPVMTMRGPVVPTIVRPPISLAVAQTEKPMTTIYVGKIASTVDNDFMLSLLQLCGPVKSWKRVPDPTTGALKGFGFCEFESVEGVLRALRLLSKLSIDGQQLMLNFDKATKEYLKRFVEKKKENAKATDAEGANKEEKATSTKASADESKEAEGDKSNNEANKEDDDYATFGLVTDEDKEADKEASEKLSGMIEERIKNKPLPPPPPPPQIAPDVGGNSASEHPAKSRDGGDSDADVPRTDEEMTSKSKPTNENERVETSSPDRNNSRSKERDRAREKERELERYEREREQERAKRERDREYKIREEERRYRARLKEWEVREKEKERARKQEREREKDREQDRKYEIIDQENDDGYSSSKKRKYRNSGEEREERKRRLREKEEDMEDKVKETEEIAEAKKKEEEEREKQKEQQKHALEILSGNNNNNNGIENSLLVDGSLLETRNKAAADHQSTDVDMEHGNESGNKITQNGTNDDSETRQNNTLGPKKLGFGLVGSGKRATVPSLFHEEDEDAQKDQKMRPLVPIDYTTEELQAVRETTPVPPSSNLAAAAEFAKRIGERPDSDRERSRRSHHRDRDHETSRSRDETREKEKAKTPDNKKLLDAKQLIDTIPKTKDELFAYPINWVVYDKNGLHERMKPWISKKITEFLGEEETTLVDYIVSSTQEHVTADEMLDRLQSILDDEAEMFVLKMWRMLIFEIKKLETGLANATRPKA